MEFTSTCIDHLENKAQVDVIYTDLKAAFDRIDHNILLCKLSRLGLAVPLVNWLRSYLVGRTLRVRLGSSVSDVFVNKSGVPQGSNLGPLLFILFFNDVLYLLGSGCALVYADDLKLFLPIRTTDDCWRLQKLLNNFVSWCRRNKLIVSIPKCMVMSFTRKKRLISFDYSIDGILLQKVEQVKDLGVLMDPKLTFDLHRTSAIARANRQLGFICKIAKDFRNPYCLKSLYCSLVRPILEYAAIVWLPYQLTWTLRIERVQKRFIRRALRNLPWRDPVNLPPYPERCRMLNLHSLEFRRKTQQATFVAKLLNSEVDSPKLLSLINFRAPHRTLRGTTLLARRFHRTAYGFNEPVSSMIRAFTAVEHLFEFGESTVRFRDKINRTVL